MISADDIRPEDLPDDFRDLVETIGMDAAMRLVEARAGTAVYIPKPEALARAARDRRIRAEFDGRNVRELAKKYQLTEVWIRNIVGAHGPGRTGDNDPRRRTLPGF